MTGNGWARKANPLDLFSHDAGNRVAEMVSCCSVVTIGGDTVFTLHRPGRLTMTKTTPGRMSEREQALAVVEWVRDVLEMHGYEVT